ncbi:TetR/AcrR family transcriptional regulator [Burkholderia anthina]|uniref:TetR/AcrR family transcriptional regulator n=1 Tax=Burkholderia anthina TaxID=179879 RepID=UPI001CF3D438|nr:TetR/AcrR family transcriptional regulator [Burkholderia anthina]MCA8090085.1 TetR/AcrR family transcriptional regulator [Burkholderia anthina]
MTALTRSKTLAATIASLAEVGYAGTTISGIAERVGLTRAALIYHFESKNALMAATVDALYDHIAERYRSADLSGLSPLDQVLAVLDIQYARAFTSNEIAMIELLLAAHRDPELWNVMSPVIEQRQNELRHAWKDLISTIPADPERLNLLRDISVSISRGMTISRILRTDMSTFDRQHEELRAMLKNEVRGLPKANS